MARPRFFIEEDYRQEFALGATLTIPSTSPVYRHAIKALRLELNEQAELVFCNVWDVWLCTLISVDAQSLTFKFLEKMQVKSLPFESILAIGFSKGDTNERVVRQASELGVARIIPVLFERSVSRPDHKRARAKVERLRKVSLSASQQSHRADLPIVEELKSFSEFTELIADLSPELLLAAWEEEQEATLSDCLYDLPSTDALRILTVIGPEGGISAGEMDVLRRAGAKSLSLGPTILRVDTAVVAALAVVHSTLSLQLQQGEV